MMEPMAPRGHIELDMPAPSDHELWRRACDGDGSAFGLLFDRHSRAIYNYCFRRTADWSAAEDLTSLVFLEGWRRRESVVFIDGRVLPWLFGVTTNLIRNHRRTIRRRRLAIARLAAAREQPDFADEAVERLHDEETMRSVLDRVRRLPRSMQDVLALCVWCELSYQETAVALGVPVGTVRSRLARARARLAELEPNSGHELEAIEHNSPARCENPA
jgi:RNA polymerase sigma-70 factor (ECF subfamily)